MKKTITFLMFIVTILAFSQAPQGFNYQATVRNSAGALIVNQYVYFKFNILQNSQTSVPVFSETHYVATDDLGQVNLTIGLGTASVGTFSSINWATGTYYLGIELNTNTGSGFVAMGTTQLLSVPYALYANSAGNSQPTIPNLASVLGVSNSANNIKITNLLNPTDAQDAATKAYIDAIQTQLQAQITALKNANTAPLPNVTIGTQIWSSTNLDVSSYRDGTPIPQVTDPTAWAGLTTGAWCYYNNDSANGPIYGKLYNWYAVAGIYDSASLTNTALRKQFAPTGWHVPTDAEWTVLTDFLGGESIAGGKIKETGTSHWESPNTDATDSFGFTGLPASNRSSDNGAFNTSGFSTNWWSTDFNSIYAHERFVLYSEGTLGSGAGQMALGCSVRCIKD